MKRFLSLLLVLCLLCAAATVYAAEGFSTDEEAIERAAKSVLKLEVYDRERSLIATGSGFVAFDDRTLVTNYHVIEDAWEVVAISDEGYKFTLNKVLCADSRLDIAILGFADPSGLDPLVIYPDNQLKRAAKVVAIGSPIGIKNTVSLGNISAVYEEDDIPWIQITAPISSGSSGGALFNDVGYVIGVTSASYTRGQNMNLAINVAVVKAMYNAWDGTTESFSSHRSSADLDYTGVYEHDDPDPGEAAAVQGAWVCIKCGQKNETDFCVYCGESRPLWVCSCGALNTAKFCGKCGKSVYDLLDRVNAAFTDLDAGKYEEAAAALTGLAAFDSRLMKSSRGAHTVAAEELKRVRYEWGCAKMQAPDQTEEAISLLEAAGDYPGAAQKLKECYYQKGVRLLEADAGGEAAEAFAKAGDYQNAAALAVEAQIAEKIGRGEIDGAAELYHGNLERYPDMADPTVLKAGSRNGAVPVVLRLAKEMGFLQDVPEDETTYLSGYEAGIREMKRHFGLADDATVRLSEYEALSEILHTGSKGDTVRQILERICDLGYITELAETHDVFEARYAEGVRLAEKGLGLVSDGLLTKAEAEAILKAPVPAPETPRNLKAEWAEPSVNLSWSAVKGARWYTVLRNGEELATVRETQYTDQTASAGADYAYGVVACNYTAQSETAAIAIVSTGTVYAPHTVRDFYEGGVMLTGENVALEDLQRESYFFRDGDLYALCQSREGGETLKIYLVLENYEGWEWEKDNTFTSMFDHITDISAKGTSSGTIYGIPKVVLEHITYKYE